MTSAAVAAKNGRAEGQLAPGDRSRLRVAAELLVTAVLLWVALRSVDFSMLIERPPSVPWLLLGLVCTLPQYLGATLRWCFTAQRLGASIPLRRGLREYYVSSLLNQLLPMGIAGDVLRVARHGRELGAGRPSYSLSLRAVVLERLSGQLVLWLAIGLSAPLFFAPERVSWLVALAIAGLLLVAVGLVRAGDARARAQPDAQGWRSFVRDARDALFARGALLVQLSTSLLVLVSCVAMFACAARAMHAPLAPLALFRIAPLVLAAISLPVSFAGWGVRELASATLYAASGLDEGTGAAVGALYGFLSLAGALPGALFLLSARRTVERVQDAKGQHAP